MRGLSPGMPEQGTQAPSPAPDLIPAETENQLGNSHRDWYSKPGHFMTVNGVAAADFQRSSLFAVTGRTLGV